MWASLINSKEIAYQESLDGLKDRRVDRGHEMCYGPICSLDWVSQEFQEANTEKKNLAPSSE